MAVTIIDTPAAPNANAYVSIGFADDYFAARLFSTAWASLVGPAAEKKAIALVMATRRLDQVPTIGVRATATQALEWPKVDDDGRYWSEPAQQALLDGVSIPVCVKYAVCEEALRLLTQTADPAAPSVLSQFRSISLPGGTSLSFREGPTTNDALLPVTERLLAPVMASGGSYSVERG